MLSNFINSQVYRRAFIQGNKDYVLIRLTSFSAFKLANIALISFTLTGCGSDVAPEVPPIDKTKLSEQVGIGQDGELQLHLENIRLAYNLPAITALTVKDGLVFEIASTGYRDIHTQTLVTDNDRWAIGSLTKSMTAMVAARLVEQEVISFDSTIADIFPELKGQIRAEHESISLKQLLNMTSGLKKDIDIKDRRWFDISKTTLMLRSMLTKEVLNTAPVQERGQYEYSNVGYTIAGHMLERVTNQTWEQLISEELFSQLGITNFGFGEPSFEQSDQPKGHTYKNGKWQAITAGKEIIPKVYGPAGTVNISLSELALYLSKVLEGMKGGDNILSKESYKTLHTIYSEAQEPGVGYAMGWFAKLDNTAFRHDGFTGSFSVSSFLYPNENSAYFIAVNGDTENAAKALFAALELLRERNFSN